MNRKVTVVGAGHVGESCAMYLAEGNLSDVCLVDIIEDMPVGKGLDLTQAGPVRGYDVMVHGSNDWADMKDSDMVVITAGVPRKPGMSREDLLKVNCGIMDSVVGNIVKYAPDAMILIVSNPLDVMTYRALKKSGFPENRVFGQAGVLDSIRFRAFIAMELGVAMSDTQAMVLGGHGDSMVPITKYTTVSGICVEDLIPKDRLDAIVDRTRGGGGEIVKLLKTGSAYYAPAGASVTMVDAVLNDRKRVLAASTMLHGQYGIDGICIGVPVTLGANGVEKVWELKLKDEDLKALQDSAGIYRGVIGELPA